MRPGRTIVERGTDGSSRWWTFAGLRANVELAARLTGLRDHVTQRDNLSITLSTDATVEDVRAALERDRTNG